MNNVVMKFPDERVNLIVSLFYLANSQSTPLIMEREGNKITRYYDFNMAVHQIFDDMGEFSNNPMDYIGIFLRNENEARAIKNLVERLEIVLLDDPPDQIDELFARTPNWSEVVRAAKYALTSFEEATS